MLCCIVMLYCVMLTIQVRFVHELLCALQPGTPLMALHGKVCEALTLTLFLPTSVKEHPSRTFAHTKNFCA
jgi:hypothetical protein